MRGGPKKLYYLYANRSPAAYVAREDHKTTINGLLLLHIYDSPIAAERNGWRYFTEADSTSMDQTETRISQTPYRFEPKLLRSYFVELLQ